MNSINILWFALLMSTYATPYNPQYISSIVYSTLDHCRCVVLLYISDSQHNELYNKQFLKHITENLSTFGVQSLILTNIKNIKEYQSVSKPFFVLLSSNPSTQMFLKDWFSNMNSSFAKWLFFASEDMDIQDYFLDIIVPFNCEFLVAQYVQGSFILTEVYRVSPDSHIKTVPFSDGNLHSRLSAHKRRDSFHGLVMPAATVEDPLFVSLGHKSGKISLTGGYYAYIWSMLEDMLNFSTVWSIPADNAFGACVNGTCNGVVEMVRTQKVEAGVGDFIINLQRYTAVDHSFALFADKSKFLIKIPDRVSMSWREFFLPFSWKFWLALSIFNILSGFLFFIAHRVNEKMDAECGTATLSEELTLQEGLFIVLGSICQQGYHHYNRSQAVRIILFSSYMTAVVILAAYSAALISSLTRSSPRIFHDIEELTERGGYRPIVTKKSAQYQYLKDSRDKMLHKVFTEYILNKEDTLPNTNMEALRTLCKGNKYALFASYTLVQVESSHLNCRLVDLPFNSAGNPTGMIFRKKSWYKDIINYNLQKLMDFGIFYRIKAAQKPRRPRIPRNAWVPVTFYNISPVLIVLCLGQIASISILLLEKTINRRYASSRLYGMHISPMMMMKKKNALWINHNTDKVIT